jgi:hypothetical protein
MKPAGGELMSVHRAVRWRACGIVVHDFGETGQDTSDTPPGIATSPDEACAPRSYKLSVELRRFSMKSYWVVLPDVKDEAG